MPSTTEASAPDLSIQDGPHGGAPSAIALADACRALWLATLGLMTAFMQQPAPAHRLLLARRIARNLETLSRQNCFSADCRATFARLTLRWQEQAGQAVPDREAEGFRALLRRLWPAAAP
jgi:hypothetical protein